MAGPLGHPLNGDPAAGGSVAGTCRSPSSWPVPDRGSRCAWHLDLSTDEQDKQVERLVGLGATRVTDPDGNEFSVIPHARL